MYSTRNLLKKQAFLVLAIALVVACLTGCASEYNENNNYFEETAKNEYLVVSDGEYESEALLFKDDNILVFQNEEYLFSCDGSKKDYSITVEFPNGEEATYYCRGNFGSTSWSLESANPPDNHEFIRDAIIAIKLNGKIDFNGFKFVFSILLIGLGLFCVISPKNAWYLNMGWYYKNAEPSDMALKMYGVIGVIIIITGVVTMITGWSLP